MSEHLDDFESLEDSFDYRGQPYMFEPEYTDEELRG